MEEKKQIINVNGKFKGKMLKEEKEGYNLYKATFEVDGKDWNFNYFMNKDSEGKLSWNTKAGKPKKGFAPKDLEEGVVYSIGYTEYQNEEMEYPCKTAMSFMKPKEGQDKPTQSSAKANGLNIPEAEIQRLTEAYFKVKKPEEQNRLHYIGSIIATVMKEHPQIKGLTAIFKEKKESAAPKIKEELVED